MPSTETGSLLEHYRCSLIGCSYHSDFDRSQNNDFVERPRHTHLCKTQVAEEED